MEVMGSRKQQSTWGVMKKANLRMAAVNQIRKASSPEWNRSEDSQKDHQTSNTERKPDVNKHSYLEGIYLTGRGVRVELEINTEN